MPTGIRKTAEQLEAEQLMREIDERVRRLVHLVAAGAVAEHRLERARELVNGRPE